MLVDGARYVDLIRKLEDVLDSDRNQPRRRRRKICGDVLEPRLPLAERYQQRRA